MFITTSKVLKTTRSVLYTCRKPVTWSKKLLQLQFHMFNFCACANIKRVSRCYTFEYQNNKRISEQSEYSLHLYYIHVHVNVLYVHVLTYMYMYVHTTYYIHVNVIVCTYTYIHVHTIYVIICTCAYIHVHVHTTCCTVHT